MKKLLIRLGLFIAALLIAQIILFRFIIPPIPEIAELDLYLERGDRIIYFGDSVVAYVDPSDTDRASIAEMITRKDPSFTIGDASHGGLGFYDSMIDYVSRSPKKPDAVIIPINLGAFGPSWDMVPGMQFEKERFLLSSDFPFLSYFYRPLAISRAINNDPITEKEFLEAPVYYGKTQLGTIHDFEYTKKFSATKDEEIRSTYVLRYMYDLDKNHRKLIALQRAIDTAQKAGMEAHVYITPLNYQEGLRTIGKDFALQIKRNAEIVCSAVKEKGLPCLDLSFSVPSKEFEYRDGHANEHMRQNGRKLVAEKVYDFFLKD